MVSQEPRPFKRSAREPLLTSRLRGNPENRLWAKVLDAVLVEAFVFVVQFVWHKAFLIVPILMWAVLDRMGRGQSPGKWLLGLHTIESKFGRRPNILQSLVRNLPAIVLSIGLGLQGWFQWLVVFVGFAAAVLETYFIFALRSGVRVGDILAGTRVFDYKDEHTLFIEQFLKEPDVL